MPRKPGLDAPGTLHHVIGRGIEGAKIFRNRVDRVDFLDRLAILCEAKALGVYAWALLETHFHLLVRSGNQSLPQSMRQLLTGYVVNFNRRHKRYGHLFQNRYKSILCEQDPYLLELTRYIHLNPIRAGVVKTMRQLAAYPWTGHGVIMGRIHRSWQDVDTVLSYFGKRRREAIRKYERYVAEGVGMGKRPELGGGGLIWSKGGGAGGGGGRGVVVRGRKLFCQVALRKLGYTGASVARFLGMTTSSVNRMGRLGEVVGGGGGGR